MISIVNTYNLSWEVEIQLQVVILNTLQGVDLYLLQEVILNQLLKILQTLEQLKLELPTIWPALIIQQSLILIRVCNNLKRP